jgi:hypothetical protein
MFHHLPSVEWWRKTVHLMIETTVNIGFFALVYGFQRLCQTEFIPTILIVYYGIIYVSVHIINYSLCHASPKHVLHHHTCDPAAAAAADDTTKPTKTATKNYGPDTIDHLFGTNDDDTFENLNHMIPNILVAFFFCWYFFTQEKIESVCVELVPMNKEQ